MAIDKRSQFIKAVGQRISELRKKKGLSQEALASKIGIDRVAVGYIEQGRRRPSLNTIYSIAEALEIRVADLFKGL